MSQEIKRYVAHHTQCVIYKIVINDKKIINIYVNKDSALGRCNFVKSVYSTLKWLGTVLAVWNIGIGLQTAISGQHKILLNVSFVQVNLYYDYISGRVNRPTQKTLFINKPLKTSTHDILNGHVLHTFLSQCV